MKEADFIIDALKLEQKKIGRLIVFVNSIG